MLIASRKFRALTLLFCFGTLAACSKPDYETADGSSGRLADARGKWLLINYWADWCKPCIEEMPELYRFQKEHSDRVVFLTVNYDGVQGPALQQQIKKIGIELPVLLHDPAALLGFQRPEALPTTIVFDTNGVLRQTLQGPQTAATLAAAIEAPPAPKSTESTLVEPSAVEHKP